ncbi:MAG TPA: hypothetical protein PLL92_17315, partial [Alicycliphilus sp.]|nr:hypothetical protein [Alicycliphilus sp.]
KNHLPVQRYVTPDEFKKYREFALNLGFVEAVAGPFVRSSYRAERVLEGNNLGLDPVNPEVLESIRESAGASLRC